MVADKTAMVVRKTAMVVRKINAINNNKHPLLIFVSVIPIAKKTFENFLMMSSNRATLNDNLL